MGGKEDSGNKKINNDLRDVEELIPLKRDSKECSDITTIIGTSGRWQFKICIILSIPAFFNIMHLLAMSFFAPGVDHWCKPPEGLYSNWTVDEWKKYSLPPDDKVRGKYDSCKMYDKNYSMVPESSLPSVSDLFLPTTKCQFGWDYDTSHFTASLENEYDLVCQREALAKTGSAIFNAGVLVGVVISGQISDMYGRKVTMMITLLCGTAFGITTAFMPTLELFFFGRFVLALCLMGWGTTAFVLMMEFFEGKWRSIIGVYNYFTWVLGYLLLPGLAYLVPGWRHLQLLFSVPLILYVAFWWFVPESIRWLLSKGRVEEAEAIAREGANVNKRDIKVNLKDANFDKEEEKSTSTMLDLFRYPRLKKNTMIMCFQWTVNSLIYYGLSLGTRSLGGNLFVTFTISGLVEIPSYIACPWLMIRFGRRSTYCVLMIIGGVACVATAAFEKGVYPHDWPIVTLAMIGKFCVTETYLIIYIYAIEIYPTPVRNVGVGLSSMCARIGSIVAPYIDLLRHVHPVIPLVLFGLASVAGGLLVLLLPETNNKPLPQTFEDAEEM